MITLEKLFTALEKVKTEGKWAMGLIIAAPKAVDFELLRNDRVRMVIDDKNTSEILIAKISKAFKDNKWVVIEIKASLPGELFNLLKLLSAQNRLQLPGGEVVRQPDSVRVIAVAAQEAIKRIEKDYSDFKYLFGPVIIL